MDQEDEEDIYYISIVCLTSSGTIAIHDGNGFKFL